MKGLESICTIKQMLYILGTSLLALMPVSGYPISSCTELSKSHLHYTWASYHADHTSLIHESFYLVPEFRQSIAAQLNQTQGGAEFGLGEVVTGCQPSNNPIDGVNKRSYCPWYHVMSYDPNRYPDLLVEARTSCTTGPFGEGTGCEKLTYNVPVLRKTGSCDSEGYYQYEQTWQSIVVGYTTIQIPTAS